MPVALLINMMLFFYDYTVDYVDVTDGDNDFDVILLLKVMFSVTVLFLLILRACFSLH